MFDLGIEGGVLITGSVRAAGHVYVADGRIAALSTVKLPSRRHFDASGLFVLPGMVDTHVHLMDPGDTSREDVEHGTAAAVGAGVTTIIEHTHGRPVLSARDLANKRAYVEARARCDFGLAAHAWPDRLDLIEETWRAGAAFFKGFTCTTHGVPGFSAGRLRMLFGQIARVGAICLMHCEDESITQEQEEWLRAAGRVDGMVIPEWRHRDAEIIGLSVAAGLSARTGARVVAAHVSHLAALRVVTAAAKAGAPIVAETCPQYLTLYEAEIEQEGPLRKFTPPARATTAADLDAMWDALATGRIHHISSDHAPSTLEHKRSGSIWDVHFGLPGLDTTMGILVDAACRGRISFEQLVRRYAEAPAVAYGLAPRKGYLRVGSDADLALVDPAVSWIVRPKDLRSRAGWSPYEGRQLHGRVVRTYLRGRVAATDDAMAEPGVGEFIPGSGWRGAPNV